MKRTYAGVSGIRLTPFIVFGCVAVFRPLLFDVTPSSRTSDQSEPTRSPSLAPVSMAERTSVAYSCCAPRQRSSSAVFVGDVERVASPFCVLPPLPQSSSACGRSDHRR
jgi:hypothetical protein